MARFLRQVGDLVEAARPRRVLEVGCGEGTVLRYLTARLPRARLDALELDAAALGAASRQSPGGRFVRGDACELPFRSRAYELVVCLEVLEHLPEPGRAFRELRRVASGGCLVSVPHEPYFRLGNLCRGRHLARLGNPSDHLQHWGAREFRAFCGEYLSVRTATTAFPWLIVYGTV